jgi:hypothetical protein
MLSLVALVTMTMTSCMHVKIGDRDWSFGGHSNKTPTQVHQVDQLTEMAAFDKLNVAGPFNVIYEQGEANTVLVKGTTEQLEKMTIYVEEGELYIDQRESKWSGNDFKGLQVFVTSQVIKDIDLAGSGKVTAPQAVTANDLLLEVAGSGEITLAQLKCKGLHNEIAGSGKVTLGVVQTDNVKNEIAGSGDIDIAGLTCKTVHNEIAGSGDIILNNLDVDEVKSEIAGSGDVILRGNIRSHKEDIAGSGKVKINEK